MFNQHSGEMFQRRYRTENSQISHLHNVAPVTEASQFPSPADSSSEDLNAQAQSADMAGTWGERDVGGPVSRPTAMAEFDEVRKELTKLSLQRTVTRESNARPGSKRWRQPTITRTRTRESTADTVTTTGTDHEPDADLAGEKDLDIGEFLKDGHFEKRTAEGDAAKKVGVIYKNLTVKGVGAKPTFTRNLPQAVLGTFGPDLYHLICRFFPRLKLGKSPPLRNLIHDFTGNVRDGEMMLVLGRPGSGCSTFLKVIANKREAFAAVEGDVTYGGIPAAEQLKRYRGEVNYNPEDDQHLPSLTVWQTLRFALMNKTKKHDADTIPIIIHALLKMFGISHTANTLVGDEYVRGVSGGERKRVGIAETLATKSTVVCWDNSTRGLDASTALDYAKSLRLMTDISNRTTIVTLYQAGEEIYELMDTVLLIEGGRMIYQGPANLARQYFIDLGFHAPDRQTTADFLTSIGDVNERQFLPGKQASTPKSAEELEAAFRKSDIYKHTIAEVERYEQDLHLTDCQNTRRFQQAVEEQKSNSKFISSQSSHTVSFWRQVLACTLREFWLFWGDKTSLYTKFFIIISNGLIVGSLFYGTSLGTEGAFPRTGALFFLVLFLGWLQLTELMRAVSGRVVISRHNDYAFYRPSAVVIARVLLDLPLLAVSSILFSIILYFLSELDVQAGKFFINLLFVYVSTLSVTALYRMFAALSPTIDDAVRFSGIALNLLVIFVGYPIPKRTLTGEVIWFGWLYYINPLSYAFEAVVTNEFSGRTMECSPMNLVPQGPGVEPQYQGCAVLGSTLGSPLIDGDVYSSSNFGYSRSHLWRNFGVIIAFTVLYILITAVAAEVFSFAGESGGALVFKKTGKTQRMVQNERKPTDEETAAVTSPPSSATSSNALDDEKVTPGSNLVESKSIFTWEDVRYEVPYQGGTKKLLNGVNGYVKPGMMIALMGASGAGKTTLLNTLSQRQTTGTVSGDMLVDGKPLGIEFQRGTGFCEQMDLHDETATIREALEFSAILRQERSVPKQEKLDYVNQIIDLLELKDIEDAIVGSLGVEQRKRLTIGVELAARPELLLFLDEPTSGLDSQSAFSIIRFLKKLSQSGQAIICTIHQPSSMLIQQFDMVLALNPGGNPFYFGPVGDNGSVIVDYFAKRGTQCPPQKNVAEFLLETAAKGGSKGKDGKRVNWNKEWLASEQYADMMQEIQRIKETRVDRPSKEFGAQHAFAAPVGLQTLELTKRTFRQYWRDPSYLYSKLFVSVIIGIFNGFTFYNLDNSFTSLQSRMFTPFLVVLIPPTIVNGVVPKFYQNRSLWESREHPSRIYGWVAFCTAQIVAEIPMAVVSSVIYWLLWYYPTNLPRDSSTAGYMFLMTMLFYLFMASWGQWICAFAPSFTIISNCLPFFFVVTSVINGIVRSYEQLPAFWRYFVYYLNPVTYWIGGSLAATMHKLDIECRTEEMTLFNAPAGESCEGYAGDFVRGATGYVEALTNGTCAYCGFRTGDEYLATLNIQASEKWRDFGIFLVFVFTNWLLVYVFIYTVRVRKWTYGMGPLFDGLGKVVRKIQRK
ncbi:hypothetical protein PV10_01361 [Exophiala mesophila]|uniref:ABC multidrug transporter atrF n=2 Tax=Exophiala mesophila TaxID=212818 RepID=A0A0D1YAI3_EXOME|nr:uncharacterized protein PV10_01361 [Exophiala mesophila]KIV97641.1 hypothetical protein PV10_01361 [Exophiala mesophila]